MKLSPLSCRLVLVLVLVAAPLALAAEPVVTEPTPLFLPEQISRLECAQCVGGFTSSPGGGAASHWGKGTTCTNATNDLLNQLYGYATDYCFNAGNYQGACSEYVVYTAACYWHSGYQKWVRDGYINFGCYTFGIDCRD